MNEVEIWWHGLTDKQRHRVWRTHASKYIYQDFASSMYLKRLAFNKIFLSIGSNDSKTRLN